MKTTQNLSANLVKCMVVAATIVILSVGSAAAGQRSHKAKSHKNGLPVCMAKLNAITANLEACETNYAQAQEENSLQQTDIETCNMDLDQLLADLAMCEESEAPSSLVPGVPKTGQIIPDVDGPRDDGELQMGTAWPDPRFTDNFTDNEEDGTVTDNMTGLVWTKNANMLGETQDWDTALAVCNDLEADGTYLKDGSIPGDWRLPNVRELNSLVDYGQYSPVLPAGHPFVGVQASAYWTSTTYAPVGDISWGISLDTGYNAPGYFKDYNYLFVWCVRDGQ